MAPIGGGFQKNPFPEYPRTHFLLDRYVRRKHRNFWFCEKPKDQEQRRGGFAAHVGHRNGFYLPTVGDLRGSGNRYQGESGCGSCQGNVFGHLASTDCRYQGISAFPGHPSLSIPNGRSFGQCPAIIFKRTRTIELIWFSAIHHIYGL